MRGGEVRRGDSVDRGAETPQVHTMEVDEVSGEVSEGELCGAHLVELADR